MKNGLSIISPSSVSVALKENGWCKIYGPLDYSVCCRQYLNGDDHPVQDFKSGFNRVVHVHKYKLNL